MAIHKKLGIYWGEKGLTLVETGQGAPSLVAFVPFYDEDQTESSKTIGVVSSDLKILESLQKTIRNKGFSTLNTYVALPSKDILIRSFVIPWMKSSEIHGTVSFEAKKYIPFSIEETAYTYYPTTILQDNVRQIGIIFVAIRKNILAKYTNVFIQSGLNVVYSEPAAMSFFRVLVHKRMVNEDHTTAVLNIHGNSGELAIASKGYIKFYRDFKINTEGIDPSLGQIDDVIRARVFNEVRISFEFFARQYGDSQINKLITISSGRTPSFWSGLNDENFAPLECVDSSKLFSAPGVADLDGANAFGATMSGDISSVIDFNLFEDASTQVSLKKEEIVKKNKQLILPAVLGVVAAGLITLAFYLTGAHLDGMRTKIAALTQTIGTRAETPLEEIQSKTKLELKNLEALRSLPLTGRVSPLLIRFIKRMPEKMTVDSFTLTIEDQDNAGPTKIDESNDSSKQKFIPIRSKFSLSIDAVLHLNDANVAFDEANRFINQLRKDDLFLSRFQRVSVSSLRSQTIDKEKVTVLKITCEAK
jgi:hypothetical protein